MDRVFRSDRSRDYRRAASSRAQVAEWQNGFAGTANRDNCAVGPFQLAFNGGSTLGQHAKITIELLSGSEQFDEGGTKPTKGRIVVISFVPIDANVERRDGYR